MKTINIEIPDGHEIDQEKSNLAEGKIVFKQSKKALPKTWGELNTLLGAFSIDGFSRVQQVYHQKTTNSVKNKFVTRKQAEASIALAQLSQLREVYRQGWVPNYYNNSWDKYSIVWHKEDLKINNCKACAFFLTFQSREIAEEFLKNFRELIEQSLPLMS